MGNYSLFDIIGPVMIGPSSSHTAGACRIARAARKISGVDFAKVVFYLHGSFAQTYLGHGTDKALVAGALGLEVDDEKLRDSFSIARERGLEFSFVKVNLGEDYHPNTVKIEMTYPDGRVSTVIGSSIGGGNVKLIEVDGIPLSVGGNFPVIILKYSEQKGVIAFVSSLLAENGYNIEKMSTQKDENTVTLIVETTNEVEQALRKKILSDPRFKIGKYLPKGY